MMYLAIVVALLPVVLVLANEEFPKHQDRRDSSTIKIVSVLTEPYLIQKPNGGYEGFVVDLADALGYILNLKYELHLSHDGKYGLKTETDRWTGMMTELVENVADLVIAPFTITNEREEYIDFSPPFQFTYLKFVTNTRLSYASIRDIMKMAVTGEIQVGTVRNSAIVELLRSSQRPFLQQLWDIISADRTSWVNTVAEGMQRARGDYVFLVDGTLAEFSTKQEPCDLVAINLEGAQLSYGIGMTRNSRLKSGIDTSIVKLSFHSKYIEYLEEKWWPQNDVCPTHTQLF